MKRAWLMAAAAFVLFGSVTAGRSAAGEGEAVDVAALAQELLRGGEDAAAKVAARAKGLAEADAQLLLAEIGTQARVYRVLDTKRIRDLAWENVNLPSALAYVHTVSGVHTMASPRVSAEHEDVRLNLRLEASNVATLLDLMTEPFNLSWGIRGGVVRILSPQEAPAFTKGAPAAGKSPAPRAERVTLTFEGTFAQAVAELSRLTGTDITIDPRIAPEIAAVTVKVSWKDVALHDALSNLVATIGKGVRWEEKGTAIVITLDPAPPR